MSRSTRNLILIGGALLIAVLLLVVRGRDDFKPRPHELDPKEVSIHAPKENKNVSSAQTVPAQATKAPEPTLGMPSGLGNPPAFLNAQDREKFEILKAVLKSKNDNDLRMDRDLKNLSPSLRKAFMEAYPNLPMEDRNERGTIVFLIARDFENEADLDFLKKVFEESPCTSFKNCRQVDTQDPHTSGINEASLNYPQFADLYQLERRLQSNPALLKDSTVRDGIIRLLKSAEDFPVPSVQKKAKELRQKLNL